MPPSSSPSAPMEDAAPHKRTVMADSGQTEEERRILRHKQRKLNEDLHRDGDLQRLHQRNNELFQAVNFTREAVLDADNHLALSAQYVKLADKMVQAPRFDSLKFVQALRKKCKTPSGAFDWFSLGREAGICFNAFPSRVSFFAGCLDSQVEKKKRKEPAQRQARYKDDAEEVRPEDVQQDGLAKDADQLSAADKNLKLLTKVLKRKTKEAHDAEQKVVDGHIPIDGVPFLFNPKSFTQTVENIFNFSFLIKSGEAAIGVSEENGLWVSRHANPDNGPAKQAVVSFTMNDWQKIVETYNLKDGYLPHRTGSKHAAPNMTQ